MLRKSFKNKIEAILESTPLLLAADFEIDTGVSEEKYGGVSVVVRFMHGDGEYFEAHIPKSSPSLSSKIAIRCSPGEFALDQEYGAGSFDEFFDEIQLWANRISEELRLVPIGRQIEAQRELIQHLEEQLGELDDRVATKEELEELYSWMSRVEAQLKDRIEQLEVKSDREGKAT